MQSSKGPSHSSSQSIARGLPRYGPHSLTNHLMSRASAHAYSANGQQPASQTSSHAADYYMNAYNVMNHTLLNTSDSHKSTRSQRLHVRSPLLTCCVLDIQLLFVWLVIHAAEHSLALHKNAAVACLIVDLKAATGQDCDHPRAFHTCITPLAPFDCTKSAFPIIIVAFL
jgi:hypothetical protein